MGSPSAGGTELDTRAQQAPNVGAHLGPRQFDSNNRVLRSGVFSKQSLTARAQ